MDGLMRNFRYAVRGLVRTPVLTITVVLTLALTIGANSAVFAVIDRVLLRPLPFADAERLVYVQHVNATTSVRIDIPPVRLLDWSERNSSFDAIAGFYTEDVTDTTWERPENLRRATAARGFLDVWGILPALGRDFTEDEHRFGGPLSILIGDAYWAARFNRDPAAIGRALSINGQSYTVVGVMPSDLESVDADADVWVPLFVDAPWTTARVNGWFSGVVGRLAPGATLEQAARDLSAVQAELAAEYPDTDDELRISVVPYKDVVVGPIRGSLWLLLGAVVVLLVIACTNIAALLLARTAQRERDIAVRRSLGASRRSVAAHLLAETAVLVGAGSLCALLVAAAAVALLRVLGVDLPRFDEIAIDARVFVYTLLSAVAVVLLCGFLPAVRGATGAGRLSHGNRTVSSRHAANWTLVGVQVALSVTLLAGAGLLLRSFDALARVDLGFEPERVLAFRLGGNFAETNDFLGVLERINRTLEELTALPGVEAAATSFAVPVVSGGFQQEFALADGAADVDARIVAESRTVSPSYFETLGIPLVAGEICRRSTAQGLAREAMVSRSFAEAYFARSSVIGRQLVQGDGSRVVGVVGDARDLSAKQAGVPTVYFCYAAPTPFPSFFVRTRGAPASVIATVQARLNELEPLRAVYDLAPLDRLMADVYAQDRLRTILLALFAATALSLACLGVYGTLAYIVSLRRREVGMRMALGAARKRIVSEFLTRALRVVGIASIVGLALSLLFARALSSMLFGVGATDPPTLIATLAIVVLVAVAAALIPALRASRIDPMQALREE